MLYVCLYACKPVVEEVLRSFTGEKKKEKKTAADLNTKQIRTTLASIANVCCNFWPPGECESDHHSPFSAVLVFTNFWGKKTQPFHSFQWGVSRDAVGIPTHSWWINL